MPQIVDTQPAVEDAHVEIAELAEVLATSDERPTTRSRILYLVEEDGDLAVAGYADAVGEVVDVLDRLDAEGAVGLAVQTRLRGPEDTWGAAVATREGLFALAVSAGDHRGVVLADEGPAPDAAAEVHRVWPIVVHALGALDRQDAVPEPPDDPHPGAYLMAAWLEGHLQAAAAGEDPRLDELTMPDEDGLVAALGLAPAVTGWDAVQVVADARDPDLAARLGRNGVAWEAHELVGDPSRALAALAGKGHVEAADRLFTELLDRGWARRA